jgi:aerobic carbon-monoxide dehydrogenase medium subunit
MRYEAPTTIERAISLLEAGGAGTRLLAGGTDLIVQMKAEVIDPDCVIDLKRIATMRTVEETDGAFRIGAAVSGAELRENRRLRAAWPGVIEAANLIGSTQVQGRATLGGNLCNASPAADSVPALIAADAKVIVAGPNGRRSIPVQDVAVGPRRTSLRSGEIVEAFEFPKRAPHSADAYQRFIPRTEMDIAVVGCGVNLTVDPAGRIVSARVALGAVAERALLVAEAGAALVGATLDDPALARLEAAARAACRPIDDKRGTKEFRIQTAGVLARRTVLIAYERARA